MIRMETVIGNQHHRSVRASQFEQRLKHHVVKTVSSVNDVFVYLKLVLWNARDARWMVVHEPVTEVIDAVVVHRQEIPGLVLQNPGGGIMNRAVLGQNL